MPRRGKIVEYFIDRDPWRYIYSLMRGGLAVINVFSNAVGVLLCIFYFLWLGDIVSINKIPYYFWMVALIFAVTAIVAVMRAQIWSRNLIKFIRLKMEGLEPSPELTRVAQKKVLNMPMLAVSSSVIAWCLSAVVIAAIRLLAPIEGESLGQSLLAASRILAGMLISCTVTIVILFFTVEISLQHVWPYFFPARDMIKTPNVYRLKLRTRLLLNTMVASVLPLVVMVIVFYNKTKMMLDADASGVTGGLLGLSVFLLVTTLFVSIALSHIMGHTIVDPVESLADAMEQVENGDLNTEVQVVSMDELGVLSHQFNQMILGLKERAELRHSLSLAKEVQQSLIPKSAPNAPGLDIAGNCIYCDETGGDYYDYLFFENPHEIGLVVGDVSGHGISAALLMASARARFRQRAASPGSLGQIVTEVNRQLVGDVGESGQFSTFFCCKIDSRNKNMVWVNAGHDPALIHDPEIDDFVELTDHNPALGLLADHEYQEHETSLTPGQVLLIGTDGIWEAHDPSNRQFGKERFKDLVRLHRDGTSRQILETIIKAVLDYRSPLKPEDDLTLVVVKIKETADV